MAREQIKVLKKKLDDAEKAKDQAEQDGYDMGGSWDREGP